MNSEKIQILQEEKEQLKTKLTELEINQKKAVTALENAENDIRWYKDQMKRKQKEISRVDEQIKDLQTDDFEKELANDQHL